MKNLIEFNTDIKFILTDIDDTLTSDGQLHSSAYSSLWRLRDAGLKIIPITGRPAGWCEMIARQWPVDAVIGENGGFYFRYALDFKHSRKIKKMQRWFYCDEKTIAINRQKLNQIEKIILTEVPGSAVSSDQFCRLMDLAIDFCEDVTPLDKSKVKQIVDIFEKNQAHAKVSSIHVNAWFGDYNKLSTTLKFFENEYQMNEEQVLAQSIFVGDSPNDEPLFSKFPLSFGVANILKFAKDIKFLPQFVTTQEGGEGFTEIADHILKRQC